MVWNGKMFFVKTRGLAHVRLAFNHGWTPFSMYEHQKHCNNNYSRNDYANKDE